MIQDHDNMTCWVYINPEPGLYTVGFYKMDGTWIPESDHDSSIEAIERTHYLNGGHYPFPEEMPMEQQKIEAAKNYDQGKIRYELIPADALREVARLYTEACATGKYPDRNWEKGMSWERVFGSLERHIQSWQLGEDNDPEFGIHHMAHAAFRCLQLLAYHMRSIGTDDRPICQQKGNGLSTKEGSDDGI